MDELTKYRNLFLQDVHYSFPTVRYRLSTIKLTEAYFRRNRLFTKYVNKKDIPYRIGRILIMAVAFLVSFGTSCGLAYLINDFFIGCALGALSYYFMQWVWLAFVEDFRFEIEDKPFIRIK